MLGLREQLVAGAVQLVGAANFDADLVDRACIESRLAQLLEQAVAIGNARGFDLEGVFGHTRICPASGRAKPGPTPNPYPQAAMAVATGREYGLFING